MNDVEQYANYLMHFGRSKRNGAPGRGSGRYPLGSGKEPYQALRRTSEMYGEHTIPKGTTMYRASAYNDEKNQGSKYVTYIQSDRDLYRSSKYGSQLMKNQGKKLDSPLYEYKMTLKEDLHIPSKEEVQSIVEEFETHKNLDKIVKENGKAWVKNFFHEGTWDFYQEIENYEDRPIDTFKNDNEINKYFHKKVEPTLVNEFVSRYKDEPIDKKFGYTVQSFGPSQYNRNLMIKELKKRGYNAMVDEAGVGVIPNSPEGVSPLIIFDSNKSLEVNNVNEVPMDVRRRASDSYDEWHRKATSSDYYNDGRKKSFFKSLFE